MKNILNEKPKIDLNERLRASVSYVSPLKNKVILDIGCGYGWFELYALKKGVKQIVGTEITVKDLVTAKRYVKDKRAIFTVGSAIDLPYKNKKFDIVTCWEVIEHIPKDTEEILFSEVSRVLKNKGYFYLSTPYNSFVSTWFDPAWWLRGHRHYYPKTLERIAHENGFRVVNYQVKGKVFTLVSLLHMYFSKWILRKQVSLPQGILEKVDREYKENNGYMDLFMKFQKINNSL